MAERLEEVASRAVRFYERVFPILASLFAEPALLARYREALAAAYHWAKRELGVSTPRLTPKPAPPCFWVPASLLGACFQRAFSSAFSGELIAAAERARLAASLATCLLADRA